MTDTTNFPASRTIAAVLVELEPGAMRELHWHPNGDEWQYYLEGEGRMTVFGSEGRARTFDYRAGDVGYVPFAMGHYIENTGPTTMRSRASVRATSRRAHSPTPTRPKPTRPTAAPRSWPPWCPATRRSA